MGDFTSWHHWMLVYDQNDSAFTIKDGVRIDYSAPVATWHSTYKHWLISQGESSTGSGGQQDVQYTIVRKYHNPEPAITVIAEVRP